MMVNEAHILLERYLAWIKDKTVLEQVGEYIEITTPSLDRHNDYIQIYLKKEGDHFLLTDDGYVINDLENDGCVLNSQKRQKLLLSTLRGFGIEKDENALVVRATADNFPLKKHSLIQAMLAITGYCGCDKKEGNKNMKEPRPTTAAELISGRATPEFDMNKFKSMMRDLDITHVRKIVDQNHVEVHLELSKIRKMISYAFILIAISFLLIGHIA